MTEPNVRPFSASVTYDLATYKELDKFNRRASPWSKFSQFVIIALTAYLFYSYLHYSTVYLSQMLLYCWSIYWGTQLLIYLINRNGGTHYKGMLSSNNGVPPHLEYSFLEDGIHICNTHTGGVNVIPYTQIRNIFETKSLFVLVLEHRLLRPIRKDSICGGPACTFTQKLLDAAVHVRRKQVKTLLPGKIFHSAFVVFSICCVLLAVWWSAPMQYIRASQKTIHNNMDYRQIGTKLESLGIHDIPEDVYREIEAAYAFDGSDYYFHSAQKCITLLSWVGMGKYNVDTWEWIPSESGVYCFDTEAFDLEHMYTNLLRGISALDKENLCFTDVQEDTSNVDWMAGTGTQTVSFQWNGQSYTISASVNSDWYDLSFLEQLNKIIKNGSDGQQLYFAHDLGQGFLVFFGDAKWANRFEAATGIQLYTNPLYANAIF